jgi:hypothetical protein
MLQKKKKRKREINFKITIFWLVLENKAKDFTQNIDKNQD